MQPLTVLCGHKTASRVCSASKKPKKIRKKIRQEVEYCNVRVLAVRLHDACPVLFGSAVIKDAAADQAVCEGFLAGHAQNKNEGPTVPKANENEKNEKEKEKCRPKMPRDFLRA